MILMGGDYNIENIDVSVIEPHISEYRAITAIIGCDGGEAVKYKSRQLL